MASWLLLWAVVAPLALPAQLDWCHYFRLLKKEHTRPECYGLTESRLRLARRKESTEADDSLLTKQVVPWKPRKNYGLETCWGRFGYCRDSKICNNGQMCVQMNGYCCSPWNKAVQAVSTCPGPQLMSIKCKAKMAVTWCHEDHHCHSAPVRRCCPTLCGYNICI